MWPLPEPEPANAWTVPWDALQDYDWVRAWKDCPQDPRHHAEGDVWIHTRMVLEALAEDPNWRALPEDARRTVWAGAVLHDLAKPQTTRTLSDGSVSARGHSRLGALMARSMLWKWGVPFTQREAICALILRHQTPFYLLDDADPELRLLRMSLSVRCDWLTHLATADMRGRVCEDQQRMLDNVLLFAELAREQGCWSGPPEFPSDLARYATLNRGYARGQEVYDDSSCEVVLMCGLPGAGKDHWLRTHAPELPVVSMDSIRRARGIKPTDNQGQVRQAAKEQAREHLRAKRSFAWSATNLGRQRRAQVIKLLLDYGAKVTIVYVEAPMTRLFKQNRDRHHSVPESVLRSMIRRWEVPTADEAHSLVYSTGEPKPAG